MTADKRKAPQRTEAARSSQAKWRRRSWPRRQKIAARPPPRASQKSAQAGDRQCTKMPLLRRCSLPSEQPSRQPSRASKWGRHSVRQEPQPTAMSQSQPMHGHGETPVQTVWTRHQGSYHRPTARYPQASLQAAGYPRRGRPDRPSVARCLYHDGARPTCKLHSDGAGASPQACGQPFYSWV